jgi:hypothetical protein
MRRAQDIEALARQIAAHTTNLVTLDNARIAAQAMFDLAQIGLVKVALISQAMAFGQIKTPRPFKSLGQAQRFNAIARGKHIPSDPPQTEAAMPITEPERTAEAVRRALPELIKLDRYERRAAAQRDRALRRILGSTKRR